MIFFLAILPVLYLLWLIVIFVSWTRIPAKTEAQPFNENVAVIIPVRNEESGIGSLLSDLDNQDYPRHLISVYVVDDASTDMTSDVVRQMQSKVSYRLKYSLLKEYSGPMQDFKGKKSAITQAMNTATEDLIVQTDGDSRVNPGWISSLVSAFNSPGIKFAAGPVIYIPGKSILNHLLQFDMAGLGIVSASMIRLGLPVMCNGANMAYRRESFIQSGGYSGNSKIASGDDSFLMHSIAAQFSGSVKFVKNISAIIRTRLPATWDEFFEQRKRWAGKWKYHSSRSIKWLALFIFFVHLDYIYLAAWSIYSGTLIALAILITARLLAEWILLKSFLNFAGCKASFLFFLVAAIMYPFYAVFFGIFSNTATFTWKGRTYRH